MTATSANSEPVILRGMTWDHPRGVGGLRDADAALIARHGVSIRWEARSLLDFGDQHVADFAADFDLLVIDHPHVPDAVAADAILALDLHLDPAVLAELERESVGRSHESYRYRGHQWAFGVDAAAQVSAFRPDLVDGVPPYWSDVLDLARRGRVLWPYKPVDAFSTFATLLAQKGAPLASPEGFLDPDAASEVLEFMIELADAVPEWCATANPIDVAEALCASDDFSLAVALFGYTNYSRVGFRPTLLGYDDIPSFDGRAGGSTLGGAGVAVSATTRHPELAVAAAVALAGAELQAGPYTAGEGQPGNLRAWKSDAANTLTRGFFQNTLRTLERAWVRPRALGWPDLQLELSHLVRDCVVNRTVDPTTITRIERLPERFLRDPFSEPVT
jgi:multiple sugar transport system substrate-binding protein